VRWRYIVIVVDKRYYAARCTNGFESRTAPIGVGELKYPAWRDALGPVVVIRGVVVSGGYGCAGWCEARGEPAVDWSGLASVNVCSGRLEVDKPIS